MYNVICFTSFLLDTLYCHRNFFLLYRSSIDKMSCLFVKNLLLTFSYLVCQNYHIYCPIQRWNKKSMNIELYIDKPYFSGRKRSFCYTIWLVLFKELIKSPAKSIFCAPCVNHYSVIGK